YTSGTSGKPKGVLHAHRAVWGRRPMFQGWYGLQASDIVLHAGAFNWTYTLGTGLFDPWTNGATSIVYRGERRPEVWPTLIARHEATIFAAVPSVYRQMIKYDVADKERLTTLRHGLVAGEPLPLDVAEQWFEKTGTRLYEAFGMSEISTYISSSPAVPIKPGSPGKPQAGRAVAILPSEGGTTPLEAGETGLICVHRSDPGLMLRYWNSPSDDEKVRRGDWFCGGDLGRMDADGYIWFDGRNDDVMNAFGYRVAPQEVEQVLASHPLVGEVAVTDIEVRAAVSIITAFVVLVDDASDAAQSRTTLLDHAAANLAAYKCPKEIVFLDALPRTPHGKLKRSELKALRNA
ncbi:MAG: AMP-binding protein, partial [Gammaproteobacteria bacterium]|nr:AMP-binding protein [Gammaproteobacteria bacterium]